MAVTVARFTGAEGPKVWTGAAVSQSALLTVLTLVTLRTCALLNPASSNTWTLPGRHQGDVIEVPRTWKQPAVISQWCLATYSAMRVRGVVVLLCCA